VADHIPASPLPPQPSPPPNYKDAKLTIDLVEEEFFNILLANKLARIAWAILTKNEVYQSRVVDQARTVTRISMVAA
jgi:hypothetical protein